jgi:hypothetical protein
MSQEFYKKNKFNYNLIKLKLAESEDIQISFLSLLLSIAPYRKSIVRQTDKGNKEVLLGWLEMRPEAQKEWVKEKMLNNWAQEDILHHIIRSIKVLKYNKLYCAHFKMILDVYKKND